MKTDKYISYIIIGLYLILAIFGIITLFSPDWLKKIAEPGRKTEANTPFETANKLMYQGDYVQAIKYYNDAINIDKTNRNAYGNLAIAYTKINDFQKAELCLKEVEKLNVGLDSIAYLMYYISKADLEKAKAKSMKLQGKSDVENILNAQNFYYKAIQLMPHDINLRYKYSSLAMQLFNDSIAIDGFKNAIAKDLKSETFYFASVYDEYLTLVSNGNKEKALELSQIIKSDKNIDWNKYDTISFKLNKKSVNELALAYFNLGELLYRNKEFEQAELAFNNAAKINPALRNNVAAIKEKYIFK